MRRKIISLPTLTMLLFVVSSAHAQTKPATTQAANEPLVGGALRYAPPAGWELVGEKNDKLARYRLGNERAYLEIAVDVLPSAVGPAQAAQMAMQVGKAIREQAKKESYQLLYGPRAEKDDRFWVKIHDRMKVTGGQTSDRMQMYRNFGVYCVRVTATAMNASEADAKKIHEVGEDLLDTMRITRGVKPSYFPRTEIKITPPVDWKEQKTDRPNDLVATYTFASKPTARIIIRAKILPKDARTDETRRNLILDKMIDDERQTTPYSKTSISQGDQPKPDDKSLRRIVGTATEAAGKTVQVDTRYGVVADLIVSVRTIAEPADAAEVNAAADSLVIAPIRD